MVDYKVLNNVVKIRMTLEQFQGQESQKMEGNIQIMNT